MSGAYERKLIMKMKHLFKKIYFTTLFDKFVGHGYGCRTTIHTENGVEVTDNTTYFEQIFPKLGFYRKVK